MADELLDSEGDLSNPSPMDAMRGTIFVASLRWLRERGLAERYLAALGPSTQQKVLLIEAAAWVPMDLVLRHYQVLDDLALSFEQRVEFGASVSRSINGVVLNTIARLAGKAGLTPLTPLSRAAKLFARNYRGGAIAVYKVAPNDARCEVHGAPMAVFAGHRDTIVGALLDGVSPFAADARVTELVAKRSPTSYALRIRW